MQFWKHLIYQKKVKMMKQIISLIKKSKNVAVFGHQSPDGDCLGSISAISFLLQELDKRNEKGYQTYLIFGSKNKQSDFIFEDELKQYQSKGVLTELNEAFSRDDQNKKIYVQDVLKEKYGTKLKELIKDNKMYVYICGSLSMGRFVKSVISETVGKEIYDEMVKEKRLITEFWENK